MRFLKTRIHGYLDYLVGLLLIVSPWLFSLEKGGAASWTLIIFGAGAIVYSFITDYELGAFPMLSVRTHLTIDLIAGIVLAASPWIFNFAQSVWAPHLGFGLFSILASLVTLKEPEAERRAHGNRPAAVH
mgnify:CR=1 FL=1